MTAINSAIIGTVSTETLTAFVVENVTLALANTEYSHTLPASTKHFVLQNRNDGIVKLKAVTGGDILTLYPNVPYSIANIKSSASITVILESPKAAQVIEIISWS